MIIRSVIAGQRLVYRTERENNVSSLFKDTRAVKILDVHVKRFFFFQTNRYDFQNKGAAKTRVEERLV